MFFKTTISPLATGGQKLFWVVTALTINFCVGTALLWWAAKVVKHAWGV